MIHFFLGDAGVDARWLATGESYAAWIAGETGAMRPGDAATEGQSASAGQMSFSGYRVNGLSFSAYVALLERAYAFIPPGGILVVNAPARTDAGATASGWTRDTLDTALFRAGFDNTLMWAGREALQAEVGGSRLVARLLPSTALGAGPSPIPGVARELIPPPDRIIAFARRSERLPPAQRTLRLSVIMPVYNERTTFAEVLDQLLAMTIPGFEIEICLVESNSTDGTREEVMRYKDNPRVRIVLEDKPLGKGHAVRAGLALATGDILLIQDADLEYDLADYPKLLAPIKDGKASFILGSRHPVGESRWKLRQFEGAERVADVMNVGHLFFTWLLNAAFRQRLRDPYTMFKVFRRSCIHNVRFECNRFDFDIELVGKLVRKGFNPREIDITYRSRSFDEGKKVSFFRDPPTWIKACLTHRFSNLHIWPGRT